MAFEEILDLVDMDATDQNVRARTDEEHAARTAEARQAAEAARAEEIDQRNAEDAKASETLDSIPAHVVEDAQNAGRVAYLAAIERGESTENAKLAAARAVEAALDLWETSGDLVTAPEPSSRTSLSLVAPESSKPAPVSAPRIIAPGSMDDVGRVRSELDLAAARAAGFSPAATVYERGVRVNETGVSNAARSRMEHEDQPLVREYVADLVRTIRAERRRELTITAGAVDMNEQGALVIPGHDPMALSRRGFSKLCSFLGYGNGAAYLADAPPALRAGNVKAQRLLMTSDQNTEAFKLRTRENGFGGREIWAAVGAKYPCFDVDQIAEAIGAAAPSGARGTAEYNPDSGRAKLSVMFHSNVQPENYVCGEFFKAGVIVRTDDTAGGSIRVSACIFQNLCLNLIILDRAECGATSIRHVGSVSKLTREFKLAFAMALSKIEIFFARWGYAAKEDAAAKNAPADASVSVKIRGIFAGLLDQDKIKVPGMKRRDAIDAFEDSWRAGEGSAKVHHNGVTRAAIVDAITRAAHTWTEIKDSDVRTDLETAGGDLLMSTVALPWADPAEKKSARG